MQLKLTGITIVLTLACSLLAALPGCDQRPKDSVKTVATPPPEIAWHSVSREIYWGIPASIKFKIPKEKDATAISQAAWKEFDRIGDIFNPFKPESELAKLNGANKVKPQQVSADMLAVMRIARRVYDASGGAFDPTLFPLKSLWKSAVKRQSAPTQQELARAVAATGYQYITLPEKGSDSVTFAKPDMRCDFGGIVKGYAVDQVVKTLKSLGVTAALVQLGGEVAAFEDNNGKPWRVGVQHPLDMQKVWGVIEHRGSLRVSTSGNYRQPLISNGKSYYHIFDPRSGEPVSHTVLGVTVISLNNSADNALLDAAATAATVLGPAQGLKLTQGLKTYGIIIHQDADGITEIRSPDMPAIYKQR